MSSAPTPQRALYELSRYLPAKHQSEMANEVYLTVQRAFAELDRQLVARRAELEKCRQERMNAIREINRLRNTANTEQP